MPLEESKPTPEESGHEKLADSVDSAMTEEHANWAEGEDAPAPGEKSPSRDDPESDVARLAEQARQAQATALRHQAELENFRKRMRRQMEDERRYAALPLMADLLAVVDNLDRALDASGKNENASGLLEGVRMVAAQLQQVLEKHGCQSMAAVGQPFDPHFHEALAPEQTEEYPPGVVTRVTQTGYQLHDRVVRPAQVFVSTAAPESTENDASPTSTPNDDAPETDE